MQSINIRFEEGKVNIVVDGGQFRNVEAFSLEYIREENSGLAASLKPEMATKNGRCLADFSMTAFRQKCNQNDSTVSASTFHFGFFPHDL